jgi:hypothetical protein
MIRLAALVLRCIAFVFVCAAQSAPGATAGAFGNVVVLQSGTELLGVSRQPTAQLRWSAGDWLREPGPLTVTADGSLLVSDFATGDLIRIASDGTQTRAASAPRAQALALEADGGGVFLVPREEYGTVVRLDFASGAVVPVPMPFSRGYIESIVLDDQGHLLVVNAIPFSEALWRVDPATGAATRLSSLDTVSCRPSDVLPEPEGTFLVTFGCDSYWWSYVERIDAAARTRTVLSRGGALAGPQAIAALADGGVVVLDSGFPNAYRPPRVVRVDRATGAQEVLSTRGDLLARSDVAVLDGSRIVVSGDGMYVSATPKDSILEIDPTFQQPRALLPAGFPEGIEGIAAIQAVRGGKLMVTGWSPPDAEGNVEGLIARVDPATGEAHVVSRGGLLVWPNDFALDGAGSLWTSVVASGDTSALVRVDLASGAQHLAAILDPELWIGSLAAGSTGTVLLLISDSRTAPTGLLVEYDPATGAQRTIVEAGLFTVPLALASDGDGNVFVAEDGPPTMPGRIWKVDQATGQASVLTDDARLDQPRSLAVDVDGQLLVAELKALFKVDPVTGSIATLSEGAAPDLWLYDVSPAPIARGCGLGAELAPLLVTLEALRRRRRARSARG